MSSNDKSADNESGNDGSNSGLKTILTCGAIGLGLFVYLSGPSSEVKEMQNAELLMWQGRYPQAIDAYTVIVKHSPTWYWPYSGRGETYRLMGDFVHAIADLNEAIRLKPEEEQPYFRRCQLYQTKGEIDRALADCQESVRIDPKQFNSIALIARMLFDRGDFDSAADNYSKLIQFQPGVTDFFFYRGQIFLFRQDRPVEAAEDFVQAAKGAFDYRRIGDELAAQGGSNLKDLMAFEHPFIPDGIYLVIWAHIARARAGKDDATERADHFLRLGERMYPLPIWQKYDAVSNEVVQAILAPWPGAVFGLFLGKTTPEAVRAAAESTVDPEERRRRICDTDFYLAEYFLEKSATANARKLLASAASGCPATAREAGFASAELKRLGP